MEIKRVLKRLAAVGTGSLMFGATLMGAMAVDLSQYPDFFVKDGTFNGYFVIGRNANALDTTASQLIQANLWYTKPGTTGTLAVSGDAWKVGTSSKFLEMAGNTASAVTGENFNKIITYIGEDELKALASGTYSTGEKDYTYNQYLYFDSTDAANEIVKYVENDDEVTADFLYFKNGAQIARYKLEFTSPAESDVASDITGTASTTGQYLSDFDNTKLSFFGKEYTIVLATRPDSPREDSIKLVLMGGAVTDTLSLNEEKSYTLDGKEYKVKLTFVDDDEVKFVVDGVGVDKMQVGQTKKLSDGKEIGVSEILYQPWLGGVQSATFFLGAQKIELQDNNITNTASDTELVVGSETIDGANVIITGTDNNVTFRVNTIEINITAEGDYFVPAGGKLSEIITAAGNDKEVLFTNNWDIEYKGLTTEKTHDLRLDATTDRRYILTWYDGDNKKVDMPLAYVETYVNTTYSNVSLGEEADDKLVRIKEGTDIEKNDYFVLTTGKADGAKGEGASYLFQYKGADQSSKSSPQIKFKNMGSGETVTYSVPASAGDATEITHIKIGGYSCQVKSAEDASGKDDWKIDVDLNCGGSVETNTVAVKDYYGAKLNITDGTGTDDKVDEEYVTVVISTPSDYDYDDKGPASITLKATATTGDEITASLSGYTLLTPEGMSDVYYGYTTMGGKLTWSTPSGSPQEFTYAYPEKQILPQVYVTSGATAITTTQPGTLTQVVIPATALKVDDEVADWKAQNIIVVGGPCANPVAASILGVTDPAKCAEGFEPNKAKIKLYENDGKIALLVAGYAGEDTRAAGYALNQYQTTKLPAKKEVVVERTGAYTDYKFVEAAATS